jgi:hypothetical protein
MQPQALSVSDWKVGSASGTGSAATWQPTASRT